MLPTTRAIFKLVGTFYQVLIAVTALPLLLWRALGVDSNAIWLVTVAYIPLVFLVLTGPIWLVSLLVRGVNRLRKRRRATSPDTNAAAGAA